MAMLNDGDRILPAGTVVKIQGIPVRLENAVKANTHPNNWTVIDEFSNADRGTDTSSGDQSSDH